MHWALETLIQFFIVIIPTILAVILVTAGILALVVFGYSFFRKAVEKQIEHPVLGSVKKVGSEGSCNIELNRKSVEVEFVLNGESVEPEVVTLITSLRERYAELEPLIAEEAIKEYNDIRECYTEPEDKLVIEKMDALRADPVAFLREFDLEDIDICDDPEQIEIKYLTPWDPEHTRQVNLKYDLTIELYGMSCGM
jgi:hypothetical protein